MNPWDDLLARAQDELQLAREGRWDELATATAERADLAASLGPAPRSALLALEALAVVQQELSVMLVRARDATAHELAGLGNGRGAVAGYTAAQAAPTRGWVNDQA
jgi:hypothetical protein